MESNPAEPASTADTPIDPVTHEPVTPVDQVPQQATPEALAASAQKREVQVLLVNANKALKDNEVGHRAILIKSSLRDVPHLELFFMSDAMTAIRACQALSQLTNVVCRTGPVAWDV